MERSLTPLEMILYKMSENEFTIYNELFKRGGTN